LGYNLLVSPWISPLTRAFDFLQPSAIAAAPYAPHESAVLLEVLGRSPEKEAVPLATVLAALAALRGRLLRNEAPEAERLWEELREASLGWRGNLAEALAAQPLPRLEQALQGMDYYLAQRQGDETALRELLHDRNLVVAVAGDFKRGKSTLINALLGRRLLPTRVAPATAVPCLLHAGPETSATVVYANGRAPETVPIEDLERYACIVLPSGEDDLAVRAEVERISIQVAEGLPPGLMVIDLPGLNEEPGRAETAREVLRGADAVVAVLAANQLLAENELQFVEALWSQGCRGITFAVNFIDGLEEHEVRTVRERCAALLRPFGGVLDETVLLVSARQGLRARLQGLPAPESSGLPALEAHLQQTLVRDRERLWQVSRLRQVIGRLDAREEVTGTYAILRREEVRSTQARYEAIADRLKKAHHIYAEADLATAQDIGMRRQRIVDHEALFESRWAALATEITDHYRRESLPWIWQKSREWLRDELIQAIREVHPQVTPRPEGYLRISVPPGLRLGRETLLQFYLEEAAREWKRFTDPSREGRHRELEEALAEAEREQRRLRESRETSWGPLAARLETLQAEAAAAAAARDAGVTASASASETLQGALLCLQRMLQT
jgi:hypothetical protein